VHIVLSQRIVLDDFAQWADARSVKDVIDRTRAVLGNRTQRIRVPLRTVREILELVPCDKHRLDRERDVIRDHCDVAIGRVKTRTRTTDVLDAR